jgi:hypothetical protein
VNEQARLHLAAGQPVVSVDTKKKELVGRYANGGVEWQPAGEPERVDVHDFPDPEVGKAIPYGVYDLGANAGWVSVGTDHDTAGFAVATLRRWWAWVGRAAYPAAGRLLVCADAGGSNGYRVRAWKAELARFAAEAGLAVTVCHFSPGTSKWNKIEHWLFSHISTNWRGRPLVSHQAMVELIGATTTRSGLKVRAALDNGAYPLGVRVFDRALAAVPLRRHDGQGEWNCTVLPTAAEAHPESAWSGGKMASALRPLPVWCAPRGSSVAGGWRSRAWRRSVGRGEERGDHVLAEEAPELRR